MIKFYNELHLGDCVLHLHYLRNVVDNTSHTFTFYVDSKYINELNYHIIGYEKTIILKPLEEKTGDAINSWIGCRDWALNYFNCPFSWDYNKFYLLWFYQMSLQLGIDYRLDSMECNYTEICKRKVIDQEFDILLINSIGYSCGLQHSDLEYVRLAHHLSKNYNVITTRPIDGFPCTMDYGYTLLDIAKLSLDIPYMISVNTSPIHMCFNEWHNFTKVFVIDVRNTFSFDTFEGIEIIRDYIQFNRIYDYFKEKR